MQNSVPRRNGNRNGDEQEGKPYIGYVRISRLGGRQAGDNLSEDGQVASIKRTAGKLGVELGWMLTEDQDKSGGSFDRSDWARAMALIDSGEAGGLILWKQSRASRAQAHLTLAMVGEVEAAGGRLYDEDGPITIATFDGEVMTFIRAAMDHKELRDKAEGLKSSVGAAIERGAHLAAPYGYGKAPRERSRAMPLIVCEEEKPAVVAMYEMRASGMSWPAIAQELDRRGHRPRPHVRRGQVVQGRWRHQAVRQIVQSRTYLGIAHNGEHETPYAHPALVSEELWAAANAQKGVKARGPEGGYALSGLVRCSSCGYAMSHCVVAGRGYYRCLAQSTHGCEGPVNIPAPALEEHVLESFVTGYLGQTYREDEATAAVDEAAAAVLRASRGLRAAVKAQRELAGMGEEAEEIGQEGFVEARQELAGAKRAHAEALAAARGVRLPDHLDEEVFRSSAPAEQNEWLSAVYAAVVVRRSASWREPVVGRARLLAVDEVGSGDVIAAASRAF